MFTNIFMMHATTTTTNRRNCWSLRGRLPSVKCSA